MEIEEFSKIPADLLPDVALTLQMGCVTFVHLGL
jgi:hypothetical protein